MYTAEDRAKVFHTKVNLETSQIAWKDLQPYFASGVTLAIANNLDLVEVAFQMSEDNAMQIQQWMTEGKFGKESNEQDGVWFDTDALVWAVVVSPWVLVQQVHK
jgi:hypothetical protein